MCISYCDLLPGLPLPLVLELDIYLLNQSSPKG